MQTSYTEDESSFLEQIAMRVKAARAEKGLSQEKLAFEAGVTRNFISLIENGDCNGSILKMRSVAKALDITLSDLLVETSS